MQKEVQFGAVNESVVAGGACPEELLGQRLQSD
jgi:hypothetical protein